jgi:NADH:ubiquinone oxidoreductase subunit 6 (subunit J)
LDKVKGRFTKVPERNPTYGLFSLVFGLIAVAPAFLLHNTLTDPVLHQLHIAVGLGVLLEAALHFMPDNQGRHKIILRVAQLVWLVFVIVPVAWIFFVRSLSDLNY